MTFVKTVETKVVCAVEFANRDYLNHEEYKAREAEKLATAARRCEKMGWDNLGSSIDFDHAEDDKDAEAIVQEFVDRLTDLAAACNMRDFARRPNI